MNVLSLFDGMSCGQLALQRANINVTNYYASEIDKYAQIVSKENFPNTIYLGDVRKIDLTQLKHIDLLIGGSPCQSFSFAGKRKGMSTKDNVEILTLDHYLELKAQNFEFEGQSYLFWEYMRILAHLQQQNPDIKFLLENVLMGDKWQKILTRAIGINPIEINSALVCAQNRKRLYWTNIGAQQDGFFGDLKCAITQPKDKGILLKDILEPEVNEKYYVSDKMMNYFETRAKNYNNGKINIREEEGKASTITSSSKSVDISDNFVSVTALREVRSDEAKNLRKQNNAKGKDYNPYRAKELEERTDGKTGALLTGLTNDNLIFTKNYVSIRPNASSNDSHDNRAYYEDGKSGTANAGGSCAQKVLLNNNQIRRLTPLECERLQTVPDNYTKSVSDTQRYKMLGNGWTVDVIAHIFSFL